ncbi:MAG: TIGR04372 family glycosyltransferase [Candidatus Omnitrophota bacterium]|nr:TIGR04372 family glycosyltransferase [Candidatus Omnitrophota bacterium]
MKKNWSRVLNIAPFSRFIYLVDFINRLFPGYQQFVIPWLMWDHQVFSRCNYAHLYFTAPEKLKGEIGIRNLGIPENAPFICFHTRDSRYLNTIMPGANFYYHNFRDCSINNYIPAVDELTKKGYFAIRMGAAVKDPIVTANPMIIDYATKFRSDFMDIYLSVNCKFFIGCCSGIDEIPKIFRKAPVLAVNFVPIKALCYAGPIKLFIPKKLWLKKEKRLLTFREIIDSDIVGFNRSEVYEKHGIEVIENTPEEITSAVLEMEAMVSGEWQANKEEEALQQRFWSLSNNIFDGIILPRIGTEFLRQSKELLT